MPSAQTQPGVSHASADQDTPEMDSHAQVNHLLDFMHGAEAYHLHVTFFPTYALCL